MRAYPDLEGRLHLQRRDTPPEVIEAAITGMEDALRDDSMVPPAQVLYLAGRLARQHGLEARAESFFLRVLAIDPRHYDAMMELGLVRYRAADPAGALELFRRASRVIEDRPWPSYYAGLALVAMGDRAGAIDEFKKAKELGSGEVEIFHALGRVFEGEGQFKEAERQLAAAAHRHPQRVDAWSALLEFHLRHGNEGGAQEACSRLRRLNWASDLLRERCGPAADVAP
jgi:tetratricopeptide (TPR) repeat protein